MAQTKPGSKPKTRAAAPASKSSSGSSSVSRSKAAQKPVRREVGAIICAFLGLFSFIGYFNVDALFISIFCGFIKSLIGWGFYIFPPALLLCAYILTFHRGRPVAARVAAALLIPPLLGALLHQALCHLELGAFNSTAFDLYNTGGNMQSGGFLSGFLAMGLTGMFSVYGAYPLLIFGVIFSAAMSLRVSPKKIAASLRDRQLIEYELRPEPEAIPQRLSEQAKLSPAGRGKAIDIPLDDMDSVTFETINGGKSSKTIKTGFFNKKPGVVTPDQIVEPPEIPAVAETREPPFVPAPPGPLNHIPESRASEPIMPEVRTPEAQPVKLKPSEVRAESESIARAIEESSDEIKYEFPPLRLLKSSKTTAPDGKAEVGVNRERLEATLKSFGVNAAIAGVIRGPSVTRYDLELEAGVKLTKLTNLAGDLALSLGVANVRIAPIPDKVSTVGVEVPNKIVSTVYLRDIVDSPAFRDAQSRLSFAIGKDITGSGVVGNIAKLPHLLIAGTTGSGKSVCMNSLILSLIFKATPDEVRLIMIDPKMVELGIYNGIPHLYIPVVTDPKKAAGSLQWAVVEMLKRYRLFSEIGVRDLAGYNEYQKKNNGDTMPQVVIVIDELADLMLVASKEVEESICRVAQMGRASGMHLVIATQRPSADVITGLMKANIPSRIAFAVSSAMESRIILDTHGAEKLIGMGDMLYMPLGSGKPKRIQGAFVSDGEREDVISYVKQRSDSQYSDEIMSQIEKATEEKEKGVNGKSSSGSAAPENDDAFSAYDELLPQAVSVIFETKQASVSMLQRRLKLGYSRAARLVDQMEEIGVVGPFEGSKPRQIMITKQQWQEMQLINGTAPIGGADDDAPFDFSDYSDTPAEEWIDED